MWTRFENVDRYKVSHFLPSLIKCPCSVLSSFESWLMLIRKTGLKENSTLKAVYCEKNCMEFSLFSHTGSPRSVTTSWIILKFNRKKFLSVPIPGAYFISSKRLTSWSDLESRVWCIFLLFALRVASIWW